ncbi:MAG: glycosyltransferase family 39 protein [Bacteroidetes bacterium]|nr:glycosyltransferase family 39 protein [Bacteroidota bacterium]
MTSFRPIHWYLSIILVSGLLYIPFLGQVHLFDWDEINFAELAREMIITGDYSQLQINFEPFWEKPPLFIWMQAISMWLFGINEFAARLPNALIGIMAMLCLFKIGEKLFDWRFGLLWMLVYAGSFLPHFYFKSGIIDPAFNLFMFLSLYFIFSKKVILAGLLLGLAVLTKGPVALLLVGATMLVFWTVKRQTGLSVSQLILFASMVLLIPFLWFGYETMLNGLWFVQEFINYQLRLLTTEDAGHGGPFFYHFILLLIGCFPASIFAINAFRKQELNSEQRDMRIMMLILLVVVVLVFSLVKTKIVHYSSLAYYPISFLAAFGIRSRERSSAHKRNLHGLEISVTDHHGPQDGLIVLLRRCVIAQSGGQPTRAAPQGNGGDNGGGHNTGKSLDVLTSLPIEL